MIPEVVSMVRFLLTADFEWASQVALVVKNLSANAGDIGDGGLIPGSGKSPGEGNDNPFQHSSLENPMDRGTWWVTFHRVTKSPAGLKQFGILTLKAPPSGALGQVQCLCSLPHSKPVLPGGSESTCQCRRPGFDPCTGEMP